jgi:hypothetical protein
MFSKNLIMTIFLALSVVLSAAGGHAVSKSSATPAVQPVSAIAGITHSLTSTALMVPSARKTVNNGQYQITKDQFLKAFHQLHSKQSLKDSIQYADDGFSTPIADCFSTGDGGSYILASSQFYRASGVLIIFKIDGSGYIPVHMEIFSEELESVKLLPASVGTTLLLEVTTRSGLGMGRSQRVQLFSLGTETGPDHTQSFKMSEVWEYDTVGNSVRPIAGTKDAYEFSFHYASYIVIPTYFFPIVEKHDTPVIVLNDTQEIFTAQGDEQQLSPDKSITNTQKTFIWDSKLVRFVEKE